MRTAHMVVALLVGAGGGSGCEWLTSPVGGTGGECRQDSQCPQGRRCVSFKCVDMSLDPYLRPRPGQVVHVRKHVTACRKRPGGGRHLVGGYTNQAGQRVSSRCVTENQREQICALAGECRSGIFD